VYLKVLDGCLLLGLELVLDVLQAVLAQDVRHLNPGAIDLVQLLLRLHKLLGTAGAHLGQLSFDEIDALEV